MEDRTVIRTCASRLAVLCGQSRAMQVDYRQPCGPCTCVEAAFAMEGRIVIDRNDSHGKRPLNQSCGDETVCKIF
jgi:hypothetical protein